MRWERLKMSGLSTPQELADAAKAAAALSRKLVEENPQVPGAVQPVIPTSQGGVGPGGGS